MSRTKYPRTFHLPWSNPSSDDKVIPDLSTFTGKEIVVSEKMDGENTTIYSDGYLHARSIDSKSNYTRDWVKRMASTLSHDIPKGWRMVFENVAYFHSIPYTNLESFAYLLSIWDETNTCLSYDSCCEWANLLDLAMPKVFYKGPFDIPTLHKITEELNTSTTEGYVIRVTHPFHYSDFAKSVVKYVRPNHVTSNSHWLTTTTPNKLSNFHQVKPYYMHER